MGKISNIKVCLRGEVFYLPSQCLKRAPHSRLSKMVNDAKTSDLENDTLDFCIDRSPVLFSVLHQFYLDGHLHLNSDCCLSSLEAELEFWEISPAVMLPCCFDIYQQARDREQKLAHIRQEWSGAVLDEVPPAEKMFQTTLEKLRLSIWRCIHDPHSSTAAKVYSFGLIGLTLCSMVLMCLASIENFRTAPPEVWSALNNMTSMRTKFMLLSTRPATWMLIVELIPLLALTSDFSLHLLVFPWKRILLLGRPFFYLYLFALIGSWIIWIEYCTLDDTEVLPDWVFLCHCVGATRVLLIFRLGNHFKVLYILVLSLRQSARELLLLLVLIFVSVSFYGTLLFFVEVKQGSALSLAQCFWWALITTTTVGYGDVYPVSTLGYFIGSLCSISGVLLVALPIPVIATNFNAYYTCVQSVDSMRKCKKSYNAEVSGVAKSRNRSAVSPMY